MTAIFSNAKLTDQDRRTRLYDGDVFLYSASDSTRAFCAFARELCKAAFAPHNPVTAQFNMKAEAYHKILAELKPLFIHHDESKRLVSRILEEFGCAPDETFFDVPRLRTSTSDGYLTSGLAYAFKPHRDTWYSPPMCQLNWWLPAYDICPENTMAIHPHYWDRQVANSSHEFNYQEWQETGRRVATTFVKKDERKQSEALEPVQLEPQLRPLPEKDGLFIFSAAHLHSTIPNVSGATRISIDFRTVNLSDLRNSRGAPNIDSRCSGTTIRDYMHSVDFSPLPESLCHAYEMQSARKEQQP
jgi:hypothetical protein